MTDTELKAYNAASAATVAGDRKRLAQSIRTMRANKNRRALKDLLYHCNFIGWPIRLRQNGRYA
jgi:hypothetical protein